MNETKIFSINGKLEELPLFERGDRVRIKDYVALTPIPTGAVERTENNGLFVYIIWDYKIFKSKDGGKVELGTLWLADGIQLLDS